MEKEPKQEETVAEPTSEETLEKMEETTRKLNDAYTRTEMSRAKLAEEKAAAMLAGKAEAGGEHPPPKTKEELVAEDLQSVFPNDVLPRSFRKK